MNHPASTHGDDRATPRVLFVDDEALVRKAFRRSMRRKGMAVTLAEDPDAALALWARGPFDVLVTDLNMPGMTGLELIDRIHAQSGHEAFVVLSGVGVLETRCVPGVRYVPKPWDAEQLADVIFELVAKEAVAQAG